MWTCNFQVGLRLQAGPGLSDTGPSCSDSFCIHITEAEIGGGEGMRGILIERDRGIGAGRRLVHVGQIDGERLVVGQAPESVTRTVTS